MKRRTFNAMSLAAILTPLPGPSIAQQIRQDLIGYQFAEINEGRLTTIHEGMATPRTLVDDDTLFQVASCSKTVTALAILTLVRDGRIDLDQPASRYLKRWELTGPRGRTATVADLLSHAAGTTVHGFGGYGPDEKIPTLLEILDGLYPANSDAIRTQRRLLRRFRYSGGGTMVLQILIEDVTGTDFATYTVREVLAEIGAPRATFDIKPALEFAHGSYENGQAVAGGFRKHPESAAAGLWATASDLAHILQAVLHSLQGAKGAILPAELARRMVTPTIGHSGFGIYVGPGNIISHEGRNHGFDSVMSAEVETGRVRTAVTNRNGAIESYARALVPD